MNIKPIKNDDDFDAAVSRMQSLHNVKPSTPEADELDILATLAEAYEEKHHTIDPPDPIEAIKFRMEQMGLKDTDLMEFLGQRSRVSEVLNKKRRLSLTMIRSLNKGLHIPLECLIKDYMLDNEKTV
jgi:HTH-type transcriptional regulator/antitoxin HigA